MSFLSSGIGGLVSGLGGGEMFVGRNLISDPFGDVSAAEAQMQAQREALAQQERLAREAQAFFSGQSEKGIGYLQSSTEDASRMLAQGSFDANRYLGAARSDALGAMQSGQTDALSSLRGGYDQARSDLGSLARLQGYESGATQAISPYDVMSGSRSGQALDRGQVGISPYDVTGRGSTLERLMDRGDRLSERLDRPTSLDDDAGYQFRRQQGEDAIQRAASARGGRLSGRTLQELGEFNQGLASQEYAAADARRRSTDQAQLSLLGQQYGAAGGVDQYSQAQQFNQAGRSDAAAQQAIQNRIGLAQYVDQLSTNQAGRSDAAALQAQQNQMSLAGMGFGAQGQLAGLSAQQGQQLSSMQGQYGRDLAGLYSQYAGQQSGLAERTGQAQSQLYSGMGSNMANVAIGVGSNAQQGANNLMGAYQNYANTGGMVQQAQANSNRETAGMIAAFFSDLRLKSHVKVIDGSQYERIGLSGYRWKWNKIAERVFGLTGEASGVMAHEVLAKYPSTVRRDQSGYLMVNYELLDRMVANRGAA